jgi:phosphate transport system substrate-binding protein
MTVAAVGAAATAACGTGARTGQADGPALTALSAPAGKITETGSSLLYPLMRSWAAAYQKQAPGVAVSPASTSSGAGIKDASSGAVDLGASDAYLSSGDLVKQQTLLNIPLVISAQTVIYNLPSVSPSDHVRLDSAVLAGIFDGTITTWDDPAIAAINQHVTLPAVKIVPIRRKDTSGDTFLFTSYLSNGSLNDHDPPWNAKIGYGTTVDWPAVPGELAEQGSTEMEQACASTLGCIAYNGISYLAQARGDHLGEAELANYSGQYTLPTAAAINASVASFVSLTPPNETIAMIDGPAPAGYPIVNYEYAIVSSRQPSASKASALRDFLSWVITTGNQPAQLGALGFQPLPSALVALGQQQIAEIGA